MAIISPLFFPKKKYHYLPGRNVMKKNRKHLLGGMTLAFLFCLTGLIMSGAAFAERCVDNGDGTVTDKGPGLIWQKATAGPVYARVPPKPATNSTLAANAAVYQKLPFADTQDFADARRGFLGRPETLTIRDAAGKLVWDLESYKQFITLEAEAPDTVNPSLWRMSQLNMLYGLFQVTDRIYQVRGYDLSNITFIQGDTGWIVMDPLITTETARAALELVSAHLGERPITGIIYSHPHVDHYGGARGIVDDATAARIPIVAPDGFLEHAVGENVIAGNVMSRRAMYMFGPFLPRSPRGGVGSGLGMTTSTGTQSLIPPTVYIETTGQELVIDGVRMVFQMTPDTEAPVEMNTWFPDQKAMWMAENVTATMHNILTLRGAQIRDAQGWAWYLNEAIEMFGSEMEVVFQSHHWPVWGNARAVDKLRKHRDVYKYMHDQTVNLMNKGYTGEEIAEMLQLPEELEHNWSTRGYYGTLRHNVRAIYQRYMGWYDGNPANLNNLPPVPAARKYVEYMGGEERVLQRARTDFEGGEYRWVAEVLKHVVFANPDNQEARELQADAFEQMGYQAESGPWRSVYLQAALELRDGIPHIPGSSATINQDILRAMTPDMLFDYLAVRINGPLAMGKTIGLNITFTDMAPGSQAAFGLTVNNAVLNYGRPLGVPDVGLTLNKSTLAAIVLGLMTMEEARDQGLLMFSGHPEAFGEFMSLLDTFTPLFPIVTPRDEDWGR
jgi:alkyl sulfatase BDS1-like metallo-beta-lactamase superfamily hydrolase